MCLFSKSANKIQGEKLTIKENNNKHMEKCLKSYEKDAKIQHKALNTCLTKKFIMQ